MSNVAFKRNHSEASYLLGIVKDANGGELTVRTEDGDVEASRAASCLLAPAVGDEVGVLIAGDGRAFVTAVLVRADEGPTEIAVDGDLRIKAESGALSFVSKLLDVRADEGSLLVSKLTFLASSVLGHVDAVRFAARAFDSVCERVSQTARTWHRKVEELDTLRAERADYRTEQEMTLRSENFMVGARNLAKIDAEQIHIG